MGDGGVVMRRPRVVTVASLEPAIHEGFLLKEETEWLVMKTWKKRWFMLKGTPFFVDDTMVTQPLCFPRQTAVLL